jgi:hypothetical protein
LFCFSLDYELMFSITEGMDSLINSQQGASDLAAAFEACRAELPDGAFKTLLGRLRQIRFLRSGFITRMNAGRDRSLRSPALPGYRAAQHETLPPLHR